MPGRHRVGRGADDVTTITWRQEAAAVDDDSVDLRVPADPAYLAILRTAAAALAVRLDLTLDDIEDLRIAVDEACALLLDHRAHPGQDLSATFTMHADSLEVLVTGPAGHLADRAGFARTVLEALVTRVETGALEDGSWIRLVHEGGRRSP